MRLLISGMASMLTLLLVPAADAAEVAVLCANGMRTVIEAVAPNFEKASGYRLNITFHTGGGTIKRARADEPADVVIAIREGVEGLVKEGRAEMSTVLASTGISVAVRKGAARPDISTPEAFKGTLVAAKSVTYLNPADGAASGIHFAKVLEHLGLTEELKPKTLFAPKASALGPMIAKGEAELGILQYQLLYSVPGIEIIGPLPDPLQNTTTFSAAVLASAQQVNAAKVLVAYLRSTEVAGIIKARGMEPAR